MIRCITLTRRHSSKLVFCLLATAPLSCADWVSDYFANSISHGVSSFQAQNRGFYTAGGFSGRHRSRTEHPVSINLPKLDLGCGGVDLFLGGVSFLSPERLVKKLQGMIQMTPTIALDFAIKTWCKECSESMSKFAAMTDGLNAMNLNECAMSKRLVATVGQGDPNILGALWGEVTSDIKLSSWKTTGKWLVRSQGSASVNSVQG